MKKSRIINGWWLVGAAAISSSGSVFAMEASDLLVFSHGPLSLRPQFTLTEQFTDNVFYATTGSKSDLITSISPGLKLQLGQDLPTENHFNLTYSLEQLLFADNTSQNAIQHRLTTDAFYKWNKVSVDGGDHIEFLSSILGGGFSLGGTRVDRTIWSDIYRVDYKIGERMGVYVEGQHSSVDYHTRLGLFDSRTLSGTGGFEYKYSEYTFFFGEVYYGETSLRPNAPGATVAPGTRFVGGFLGARGNFTEKLRGTIKAGYESGTFQGTLPPGARDTAGDAPVVEASLTYLITERLSTTLSYSRRQHVSVQYEASSYVADAVSAMVSQVLGSTGRLRLDLTALYTSYAFDPAPAYPSGREDTNWRIQAGANWFFQTWLSTRLEYSFESFSSDFAPVVDYDVNRVTLSLAIGY